MNDNVIDLTSRRERRARTFSQAQPSGDRALHGDVIDLRDYIEPLKAEAALCSAIVDMIISWKPLTRDSW